MHWSSIFALKKTSAFWLKHWLSYQPVRRWYRKNFTIHGLSLLLQKKEVESAPSTSTEKESSQTSLKESVDEDRIPIYAEQDEFRDENDRESDGSGSSREDARHLLMRSRKLTSKVVKVSR